MAKKSNATSVPRRRASREKVETAYWQTRKGEFIKIASAIESFNELAELARSNQDTWEATTSREVVTQVYDQLGNYRASAELGTPTVGEEQLRRLKKDLPNADTDDALAQCQARAGMVLQCAIVQIRREEHGEQFGDQPVALRFMNDSIALLKAYEDKNQRTFQILHWFIFWRGRYHSTRGMVAEATRDFDEALYLADGNLEAKLIRDANDPVKRNRQIAAANYTISAILGFGMAHVRQQEMLYEESLPYLNVAIMTARCNEDYYRQGYVHYLKGVALRSRSQRELKEEDPAEARRQMRIAYVLFGGTDPDIRDGIEEYQKPVPTDQNIIPQHHLYLARTLHQLSLLSLNSAAPDESASLLEAGKLNEDAMEHSNHEDCENHRDPRLDYGIRVVRSLVATGLKSYGQAKSDAALALEMHRTRRVSKWMQGGAHVAMGRAITGDEDESPSPETVEQAARAFAGAFDKEIRATEKAAAHLYLSLLFSGIGNDYRAGVEYDEALPLIERSEHGWVKRLAEVAKKKLGEASASVVYIHVDRELARLIGKKTNVWKELNKLTRRKLLGQVLRMYAESMKKPGGVEKVAKDLGVSQVAVYNWKNNKGTEVDQ